MTFIPQKNEKYCFISCSEDKIKLGQCSCINNKQRKYMFMKTLELDLKKKVLIIDENDFDYYELFKDGIYLKLKNGDRDYIEGNFELICKGSELTEEIASELMSDFDAFNEFTLNYEYLKNFIYIISTKGFNWLENPIEKPIEDDYNLGDIHSGFFRTKLNQWQEAEEKTFRNPLIFVKK